MPRTSSPKISKASASKSTTAPPFKRVAVPIPKNISELSFKSSIKSSNYESNGNNFWSFRFEEGVLVFTNYPMKVENDDDDDVQEFVVDLDADKIVIGKLMYVEHVATDARSVNQVLAVTVLDSKTSTTKNLLIRFGDLLFSEFTKETGFDASNCKKVNLFVKHWKTYLTSKIQIEEEDDDKPKETTPVKSRTSNASIFDDEEGEESTVSKRISFSQEELTSFTTSLTEEKKTSNVKQRKKPRASVVGNYEVKASLNASKVASLIIGKQETTVNKKMVENGRAGEIIKQYGFPTTLSLPVNRIDCVESSSAVRPINVEHVNTLVKEISSGGKSLSSECGLVEIKAKSDSRAAGTLKQLFQQSKRANVDVDQIMDELYDLIINTETKNIQLFVHGSTHYTVALNAIYNNFPEAERTIENVPKHDYFIVYNIPEYELMCLGNLHNTTTKNLAMDFPSILVNVRKLLKELMKKNSLLSCDKSEGSDVEEDKHFMKFKDGFGKQFKQELTQILGISESTAVHMSGISFWSNRCWDRLIEISKKTKPHSKKPILTSISTLIAKVGSCKGIPEEEIYYGLEMFLKFSNIDKMIEHIRHTKYVLYGIQLIQEQFENITSLLLLKECAPNVHKQFVDDLLYDVELKQVEENTLKFTSTDLYLNLKKELNRTTPSTHNTDVTFTSTSQQLKLERNGTSLTMLCANILELSKIFTSKQTYDLMICDLPYGIFKECPQYDVAFTKSELTKIIDELFSITATTCKPTWIFFGEYKQVCLLQKYLEKLSATCSICTWVKNSRQFGPNIGTYKYETFLICFPFREANIKPEGFNLNPFGVCFPPETDFLKDENKNECNRGQKSLNLISWFVSLFSQTDGLVLDLCSGTGTTTVAAMSLGRNAIGIESNARQFEFASMRLKLDLFEKQSISPFNILSPEEEKQKKEKKEKKKPKKNPAKKRKAEEGKQKQNKNTSKTTKEQPKKKKQKSKAETIVDNYLDLEAEEVSDVENDSERDEPETDDEFSQN